MPIIFPKVLPMKRLALLFAAPLAALFFSACAPKQILLDTFSPPKEEAKIRSLVSNTGSANTLLSIGIDPKPDANGIKDGKLAGEYLLSDLKEMLTQTNFIEIYPIYEDARVTLHVKVIDLSFVQEAGSIQADLSVRYAINKGATEAFSKTYSKQDKRFSASAQSLPSKQIVISALSKRITRDFLKDITPLKTKKLVELKDLPSELAHAEQYARSGDLEGAIAAMAAYKGKKNLAYHYDLGVFYEGLAATKMDIKLLHAANKSFNAALALSPQDAQTLKAKGEFDAFYRLFERLQTQKDENKKSIDKINKDYEISE